MNKQELIDKAVFQLGGKWIFPDDNLVTPTSLNSQYKPHAEFESIYNIDHLGPRWEFVCIKEEFQQRASELGYINGYRWGVEYPTNGKKPDLPDDVEVEAESPRFKMGELTPSKLSAWNWPFCNKFKITDQRYKPLDISYLVSEIPEIKSNAENVSEISNISEDEKSEMSERIFWEFDDACSKSPENKRIIFKNYLSKYHNELSTPKLVELLDWYDYEAQKAVALPPAGEYCQVYLNGWYNCYIVGIDDLGGCVFRKDGEYMQRITDDSFRPLDHNRKAEAEKKRVVDAVQQLVHEFDHCAYVSDELLSFLHDKGFLRSPADKG